MSDAPDIHVCETGPRDDPQNLGEGRSAIRRRTVDRLRACALTASAHIPAKHLTGHRHEAGIPKAPWRFA